MSTAHAIVFPPFSLDLNNECLWRESERIILRPKTFAVFRYLVSHAERLVTRDELLTTIWGDTVVSETVLRGCIQEIRAALGDAPKQPQFIETMPRRGYRFLVPTTVSSRHATQALLPVTRSEAVPNQHTGQADQAWLSHPASRSATALVGRQPALTQLQNCLQTAQNGQRQVVFVTGEPGIGKTALVETFLSTLMAQEQTVWLGHGQCIEHYGAGEAFGPVLEAFGRLCRGPHAAHVITLLETYAPTWLLQLPVLFDAARLENIRHKTSGTTRERMLREMGEALEALSVEKPVVLVLEDLHWSDVSTLDLLALLARRQEQARIYVIGTYRPAEISGNDYPLRAVVQELSSHRLCRVVPLPLLDETAIAQYLRSRLPGEASTDLPDLAAPAVQVLVQKIYQRTEGNPLFIIHLIDYVLSQDTLTAAPTLPHLLALLNGRGSAQVETSIPITIRALIDKQLDRLSLGARRMLEAASAAGAEFSTPAVTAGTGLVTADIEATCRELAHQGQFIHEYGLCEWPDGTIGTHYRFAHALYQEVLYEHVPAAYQVHLHQHIGQAKETAYGQHTAEIANELAVHFERGRLFPRAIHYRQQAAENALRRYAPQEASQHLSVALELLGATPPTTAVRVLPRGKSVSE